MHDHASPAAPRGASAGHAGAERLALSLALAVLVRMADRLPRRSRGRQALAQAARPLRDALV